MRSWTRRASAIWRDRASIISNRWAVVRLRWYASSKSSSSSSEEAPAYRFSPPQASQGQSWRSSLKL